MSFFFLLQSWRTGGQNRSYLGGWYQWEGRGCEESVWESEYGANSVYTYENGEMRPIETFRNRGGVIMENGGGEWIQVWYIWYIVRTFVNATMYPQHRNFKKILETNRSMLVLKS
jgi:hypothetical protein